MGTENHLNNQQTNPTQLGWLSFESVRWDWFAVWWFSAQSSG